MADQFEEITEALKKADKKDQKPKFEFTSFHFSKDEGWMAEMIFDKRSHKTEFIIKNSDGKITHGKTIIINKKKFHSYFPDDPVLKAVKLSSGLEDYGSEETLIKDIEAFISKWADLDTFYLRLAAYYVLLTWCYDEFFQIPYLRILSDFDSGKTRLGFYVLGALCYKTFATCGVTSTASVFRALDAFQGTFILDEADMKKDSDKTAEIIQMFNMGYTKDANIYRVEMGKGGKMMPVSYTIYGPKIIIGREHFGDASTESRCLPLKIKRTVRTDIPYLIDETLEEEALILRNKLLKWRFDDYGKRSQRIDTEFIHTVDISSRYKQLLIVMSGVVSSPEMKKELINYAVEVQGDANQRRSESFEGEIIKVLVDLYRGEESFIAAVDIANEVNKITGDSGRRIDSKSVCYYLRERLQLKPSQQPVTKRSGIKISYKDLFEVCKRFSIPFDIQENSFDIMDEVPFK